MEQALTQVVEISTNLDDVTGEVVGAAIATLLDAGALDAWTTPIGMKGGRPGIQLSVLCDPAKRDVTAEQMLDLTGAFGVRYRTWDRLVLERRHETVNTRFGEIRIKVGSLHGRVITAKPEFGDVATVAGQKGVSVREAISAARAAADEWLADSRAQSQKGLS